MYCLWLLSCYKSRNFLAIAVRLYCPQSLKFYSLAHCRKVFADPLLRTLGISFFFSWLPAVICLAGNFLSHPKTFTTPSEYICCLAQENIPATRLASRNKKKKKKRIHENRTKDFHLWQFSSKKFLLFIRYKSHSLLLLHMKQILSLSLTCIS